MGKASENHILKDLQDSPQLVPDILLQSDQRTEDHLRDMVPASQQFDWQVPDVEFGIEKHHVAFVEACLLSRAADNAGEMIELWHAQPQHESHGRFLDTTELNLWNTWSVVLDRSRLSATQINPGQGEAFLRYWHFRMFERTSDYLPGLFKFAPNKIGLHHTAAPQQVISCIRVLLDELCPSLPAGLSRTLFLLSSINRVHAFVDDNGGMARFLFNWELACAGLPPIQWTPALRDTLIHCLDGAHYENNFEAFREGLQQAQKSTESLARDFSERLAETERLS